MTIGIYYFLEGPNFRPFALRPVVFELTVNFSIGGRSCGGATKVKPKSEMVKVHMLTGIYYSPEGPNFRPFHSTASRFRVTVNFSIGGHSCGGTTTVKPKSEIVKVDMLTGIYYSPDGPNFCPFRSTGSRF